MVWIVLIVSLSLLGFAYLIDRRNKKLKNNSLESINSHAKPGESTNFMMGDNKYTNGP